MSLQTRIVRKLEAHQREYGEVRGFLCESCMEFHPGTDPDCDWHSQHEGHIVIHIVVPAGDSVRRMLEDFWKRNPPKAKPYRLFG